ncbi:hypothetical protein E4191_09635 [Paracoccus liaowanqingii]|uniref:TolC family protein n=1 Tax=Paracoccus liaowanqingii TaxID=2560053 RepID=A0A4P7HLB6_9RHOB|nr:hypothetical protein [Paracoccus liaowanqingii]QBX34945.1 hypothetical protein E4191_09635 [Paracoccus liaowanqingii]
MTSIAVTALSLTLLLALAGCARPMLVAATEGIDAVHAEMVRGPGADPGAPLGPAALLASARIRGPDFLSARLEEAGARLQLDARRAATAPRLSLALRRQASLRQGGLDAGPGDASVALNWDLAAALFSAGGAESMKAAERFLPVQAGLAQAEAAGALFDAYLQHEDAILTRQEVQAELDLASCRSEAAQVELELGTISPAEIQVGQQMIASRRQQVEVAERSVQSLRRNVLYRAGIAETARIAPGLDPLQAVAPVPPDLSRAACYARSGSALRDRLLLEGAVGALRVARLQRFGRVDIALPADISPTRGLDLGGLISVLVPVVAQSDGQRTVQAARQALLDLALTAERNRRSFDRQLSEADFARAQAATRIGEARRALAEDAADPASCEARHQARQARLHLARATLAHRRAGMTLALLCAPIDAHTASDPGTTARLIDMAAPRPRKGSAR